METLISHPAASAASPDDVVLEVQSRGLNQYYRLTQFPVRIGRAFDNDIIISDPTISPHHFMIDRAADGQLLLQNLSEENGSRVNSLALKQPMRVSLAVNAKPIILRIGSRRLNLMRADSKIEPTVIRNCKGLYALLCKPVWSLILLFLTLFAFLYENYLNTIFQKESMYYLSSVLPYIMGLIAMTLLVSGISRLSLQRWEVGAAASLAALFLLVPHLLGELGHWLNYLVTADWPLDWLLLLSNFLLLPLLLYGYIRLIHHASIWPALGIALLFSAPLLVYQASDLADEFAIADEFSGEAKFNRTLSSLDIRLKPTLSIDAYMQAAQASLTSEPDTAHKSP